MVIGSGFLGRCGWMICFIVFCFLIFHVRFLIFQFIRWVGGRRERRLIFTMICDWNVCMCAFV